MATLYEIEQAIMDCVDLETGEIIDIEKLDQLQMDREVKIENTFKSDTHCDIIQSRNFEHVFLQSGGCT